MLLAIAWWTSNHNVADIIAAPSREWDNVIGISGIPTRWEALVAIVATSSLTLVLLTQLLGGV